MKRFLSIKYSAGAFNVGMLILRVVLGLLLISHGYAKMVSFNKLQNTFLNFMGMGSTVSLVLIIAAELFCSIFLILGLFTRFAVIPIMIGMGVVVFVSSHGDIFGPGERGMMYLAASVTILLCGPGRISVDGMLR